MIKAIIFVIIVLTAVTYTNDPNIVKPWRDAIGHVGVLIAKTVKTTGEAANKAIQDEAYKDR